MCKSEGSGHAIYVSVSYRGRAVRIIRLGRTVLAQACYQSFHLPFETCARGSLSLYCTSHRYYLIYDYGD